jgi:uncharacterized membrane protein
MDFPIEYRERMMAEQMVMMEAFQFIMQLLISIFILLSLVFLIVNLGEIVLTRLRERTVRGPSRAARFLSRIISRADSPTAITNGSGPPLRAGRRWR